MKPKTKNQAKKTAQVLHFTMVDEGYYVPAEKSIYGIVNCNNSLIDSKHRKKQWDVTSNNEKVIYSAKTRKKCATWLEKKTGKKVKFVTYDKWAELGS